MRDTLRSPAQEHLRALLRSLRREAQLTQAQVAERLGKPQSFVAKYEQGERRLSAVELVYVARALGAKPDSIMAQLSSAIDMIERRSVSDRSP